MGWSQGEIKTNLERLALTTSLQFTRHDPKSIMHYSLPEELFRDGRNNKCWVPKNTELSDGDKRFASSIYPPRVASSGATPSQGVRIGQPSATPQDDQKVEAEYRTELQRSFEANLMRSGLQSSDVQRLTGKFQEELAKLRSGPLGK